MRHEVGPSDCMMIKYVSAGFWSQAATTGKAPLQNLQDHIADPAHVNSESSAL